MLDFEEEVKLGEDMILINGKVPGFEIGASIILIASRDEEKLKEFIKKEEGMVFVFVDEPSMDNFRRLFTGSKHYLDSGFNLADLQHVGQSRENEIKFVKYISGLEKFLDKKQSFSFLNESSYINVLKKMEAMEGEHIWLLKDEEDREEIEGFFNVKE